MVAGRTSSTAEFSHRSNILSNLDCDMSGSAKVRVGIDTGGTFTDFVYEIRGKLRLFKLSSTPADPSVAIRAGLQRISDEVKIPLSAIEVVHGTTVGTNALLQRRGARTALVTTSGFEDVLEIGRQARPELYNLNAIKPPPLIDNELRFGVVERVVASGEVLVPLEPSELQSLKDKLAEAQVESIAISLLFSFLRPEHERLIADHLSHLEVPLSVSHEILPEYREYERTSTVSINAYLQPLMGRYLRSLTRELGHSSPNKRRPRTNSFRVMQSSGGSISAEIAASEPVRTILSGPAGGVVGALRAASAAGFADVITFDMGGTSTDVALCDSGEVRTTNEASVAGLPVAVPVMDIHTVGAGGGSIASIDEGGSLRVGPESAGADPGPACYGRSFLPTVTDAHVVLNHFAGAGLLGGDFQLDSGRSWEALSRLATDISKVSGKNCSVNAAAEGVLSIANTNMERALRFISVERGHDPRRFALLPFGGAGGLHAVELARALRIPRVIVPRSGGALSAIGVLAADVVKDSSRTVMFSYETSAMKKLSQIFKDLEHEARESLKMEGFVASRQRHERSLAVRYKGQSFELVVDASGDVETTFHREHERRYGYAQRNGEIEIVSARLRSVGAVERLPIERLKRSSAGKLKPKSEATMFWSGRKLRTCVYERDDLPAGIRLFSPCLVTEYSSTTLIPPGSIARADQNGNVIIDV